MSTIHAVQRAVERVGAVLGLDSAQSLAAMADRYAATCRIGESVALKLRSIGFTGTAWGEESNGDTIVAIIRDARVVTIMLRRSTQPFTPEALRVDRIGQEG